MSGARAALAVALALAVAGPGCGSAEGPPRLTVAAAASLAPAFAVYGRSFRPAVARFSFAGSDELAARLRQGARPDVYAAADTALPNALFGEGLVERPAVFAGNRLVLAVRRASGIRALEDLARPGVRLAIGSEGVPVGFYTRRLLRRLPRGRSRAILANVRSNEPDVAGVLGKLSQGAADAGFVYATDARATRGALRTVELPARLRPPVRYAIAVVRGTARRREARAFVAGLRSRAGARALERAGFEPR